MRTAAIILAGGRGERLGGVVKATLEIGGIRLLERVSAVLASEATPLLVAHGSVQPAVLRLPDGQIAVPDLDSGYAGPLAGLAGGVAWLAANAPQVDLVVTAAVDTPFLPPGYARALLDALGPEDGAIVAGYGGQEYPTNALWRLDRIADLPGRIAAGTAPHSLKRLAHEVGARVLGWPEQSGDPFANANTPADLAALEARAGACN
jgi:molybdopterin-guanine dinucleotide biosynthesis protein A